MCSRRSEETRQLRTAIVFIRSVATVVELVAQTGYVGALVLVIAVKRMSDTFGHHWYTTSPPFHSIPFH